MKRKYYRMEMKKIALAAMCMLQLLLAGCDKFFDARPSTTAITPVTIKDFQEMLNSDSLALCNYALPDFMSDDIRIEDAHKTVDAVSPYIRSYLWSEIVWRPGEFDQMYNSTYANILQMNIILDRINRAKGSDEERGIIRAQAQINRASYYLQLANTYGADYREAAAATDLAVPLVLSPNPGEQPVRATVRQVYDQVQQDLNAAVNTASLPGMGGNIIRPGKAAGYALLARTYLCMGRYADALAAANTSLSIHNRLLKYTQDYIAPSALPDLSQNPEVLLGRLCVDYDFYGIRNIGFMISPSLLATFSSDDIRLTNNFVFNLYIPGNNNNSLAFNCSIGVPEVMLIKAECLARKQEDAAAMALVNQLRQNRLLNYQPLDATPDALTVVLQEKRRELFYHGGLRLFDLKRLNREAQFAQTLQRKSDDGSTVLATLPVNSPRYLVPFSPVIIANNPAIIQNPR